jgi:hypothetical protein
LWNASLQGGREAVGANPFFSCKKIERSPTHQQLITIL